MTTSPRDPATSEDLVEGTIEELVYRSGDGTYVVARLSRGPRQASVIAVGNLLGVNVGEKLRARGHWEEHQRFGPRFLVDSFETVRPSTLAGIRRYLGSGTIKGIGPKLAERITSAFGEATLDILDAAPERLAEVPGIGKSRLAEIRRTWQEHKAFREIAIFCQSHGLGMATAHRVYQAYGADAISIITENPYRLARDIFGIGFRTADALAARIGIPPDSPARAEAGLLYSLERTAEEGHVCYPQRLLMAESARLLQMDEEALASALERLASKQEISIGPQEARPVYLRSLEAAENAVAGKLLALASSRPPTPPKVLSGFESWCDVLLADEQKQAVRVSVESKVSVVTGGPGVGKTTVMSCLLQNCIAQGMIVALCAPTGRAAKRLQEATGQEAKTIHRLLQYDPRTGLFRHNERNPLPADVLIVDEASMIDLPLMAHLVAAIPPRASLVIVGDADQIPSVGPGNVLRDIIASGVVPVVKLTKLFRQAEYSLITLNAHRINAGEMPHITPPDEGTADFYFIEEQDAERVVEIIQRLVSERIPARFNLDPMRDIQVIAPMHRGAAGVERLNRTIQNTLNKSDVRVSWSGREFRLNDRVMQLRNDYDKEVYNGDMGYIQSINRIEQTMVVSVDGRPLSYAFSELEDLQPAYAISVHKSQGSEYPAVVMPILPEHHILLQRNLLYTAVTRARQLVVLVGSKKALATAVRNNKVAQRFTFLREKLVAMGKEGTKR